MSARTIHKYAIGYGEALVEMRAGARLLHVDVQRTSTGQEVFAWAEVPAGETATELRQIGYFATGDVIPDGAQYVGTAITPNTTFVWHVYELPRGEQ